MKRNPRIIGRVYPRRWLLLKPIATPRYLRTAVYSYGFWKPEPVMTMREYLDVRVGD